MDSELEVIINGAAGTALGQEDAGRAAAEAFEACGVGVNISVARGGEELEQAARRALSNGALALVAGGGDGTISALASLVVGTEKALGVLPLGTLNHFAKDLRIPLELGEAAAVVCDGHVARVDAGEVNGRVFINNSSLGLYPRIVRRREKMQARDGSGKWSAFARATLAVLRRYPFLRVRLNADGREIVRLTPFVLVGNNEYEVDGLSLGGRRRLDSGRLSLYVAHRTGRLGLLWLAVRALFGRLREARDFDALSAEEIWVGTPRPRKLPVAIDGEVTLMKTPLRYRALPGALRVIVPKEP
jgi:diacylglycerol kinase family enzyme